MDERSPPQNFDTVLAAIDGTENSSRVLEHVGALAPTHGSEVIVFHVRQKAYSGAATVDVDPTPVISARDAAAELRRAGVRARSVEEDAYWAHTADAIVEAAERYSAKPIVMGHERAIENDGSRARKTSRTRDGTCPRSPYW
ncbi:MAG: universal stress protein [Actinomycetota bacterium]|nr:universal stress protein [Actinomycetota bacterium]